MAEIQIARKIISGWKGDSYVFGENVLNEVGRLARGYGGNALLVVSSARSWIQKHLSRILDSLRREGVEYNAVLGSRPNSPVEDLYRITYHATLYRPRCLIAFGGGSTIDVVKAASVLATYPPNEVSRVLDISWERHVA